MMPPWPMIGQVLSHDPANDSITVIMQSGGQYASLPVGMLYHGGADALRISKKPLPGKGTWGLVVFPNGDVRNGRWLGGVHATLMNANTGDASDPFLHYDAHFSGHWSMLDQYGNYAQQTADGSSFTMNVSGGALPATHRYTVDQNQQQQYTPFTFAQRVPSPPPPFTTAFTQATSGSLGGCSITVDASGQATIITHGATFKIDSSGNINMTPAGGAFVVVNGTMHVTGNVVAGFGGGDSVTLQNHTHGGITTGTAHTAVPDAGT